jgi:tetratricopeptide (TPR) repeat protein
MLRLIDGSRFVLLALLLVGGAGWLTPVLAQDGSPGQKAAGEALLESGAAASKQGRYADALRDYEQALARLGRPTIYYYIGDTAARLGENDRAISAFRDYLALSPAPRNRAEVEQRIRSLEAKGDASGAGTRAPGGETVVKADLSPTAAANTEQGSVAIGSASGASKASANERDQGLWWLWTGIGVAVVATVIAAVVVTTSDDPPQPAQSGDVGGTIQTLEGR